MKPCIKAIEIPNEGLPTERRAQRLFFPVIRRFSKRVASGGVAQQDGGRFAKGELDSNFAI